MPPKDILFGQILQAGGQATIVEYPAAWFQSRGGAEDYLKTAKKSVQNWVRASQPAEVVS